MVLRDWELHDPREERNLRMEAWLIGIALAAALVWSLGGSNISLFTDCADCGGALLGKGEAARCAC